MSLDGITGTGSFLDDGEHAVPHGEGVHVERDMFVWDIARRLENLARPVKRIERCRASSSLRLLCGFSHSIECSVLLHCSCSDLHFQCASVNVHRCVALIHVACPLSLHCLIVLCLT